MAVVGRASCERAHPSWVRGEAIGQAVVPAIDLVVAQGEGAAEMSQVPPNYPPPGGGPDHRGPTWSGGSGDPQGWGPPASSGPPVGGGYPMPGPTPAPPPRKRTAAMILLGVLVVAAVGGAAFILLRDEDANSGGSGSADSEAVAGLPQEDELRPALLSVSDMPAGWAEEPASDDSDDPLCGIRIGELLGVGELPHADVTLSVDSQTGPALAESLGFVPAGRGPEVIPALRQAVEACEGDQVEMNGRAVAFTVGELSLPPIGEESYGVRLNAQAVDNPSATAVFDVAFSRQGDLVVFTLAYDEFGDATELLTTWAPMAHDKAVATLQT
jgi:hypothetical protein